MSHLEKLFKFFFLICMLSLVGESQVPRSNDIQKQQEEQRIRQRKEELGILRGDPSLSDFMLDSLRKDREALYRRHKIVKKPLTKEEKLRINKILAPNDEDLIKYKEFLQQSGTGIFRLFSDSDCVSNEVLRVNGNCENSVPDKWQYSFRWKDYADRWKDYADDIQFKDGNLSTSGFLSQGILAKLGNVPLENISLASDGIKYFLNFSPATNLEKAKKQFAEISKGVEANGYKYINKLRPEIDTSYALRIIAYRIKVDGIYPRFQNRGTINTGNQIRFYTHKKNRIDLTVAFRIIRKEKDGSILILWKELKRQEAPQIVFSKGDILSDIKPNVQ